MQTISRQDANLRHSKLLYLDTIQTIVPSVVMNM